MEQKQLSLGAIIQIVASFLIFISVFMPWFASGDLIEEYTDEYVTVSLMMLKDAPYVFWLPWLFIVLSIGSIALTILKRKKVLSIILFIVVTLVIVIFIVASKDRDVAKYFDYGAIRFGSGFVICLVSDILLLIGMFLDRKKKPANDVQPKL